MAMAVLCFSCPGRSFLHNESHSRNFVRVSSPNLSTNHKTFQVSNHFNWPPKSTILKGESFKNLSWIHWIFEFTRRFDITKTIFVMFYQSGILSVCLIILYLKTAFMTFISEHLLLFLFHEISCYEIDL